MSIDLYGSSPVDVLKRFTGAHMERGKRSAPMTQKGALGGRMAFNERRIHEALNAWGSDVITQFDTMGDEIGNSIRQDIQDARYSAQKARAQNDMTRYKTDLQRILFDKQMAQHKQTLSRARLGDILSGIIAGAGQFTAGYIENQKMEEDWARYMDALREISKQLDLYRRGGDYSTPYYQGY